MPVGSENNLILVEKKSSHVALVTLNNPPMNLNSVPSMKELHEVITELDKDSDVRVVILTGSGTKAFNVGSDMSGFKDLAGRFKEDKFRHEMAMLDGIEFMTKPTICAIEGYCMGGGLELALCFDLRVVSEKALFAQPEINLGLFPAGGGVFRLPRLVGYSRALELMYLGETIDAQEAYRIGLANKVVPAGTAVEAAMLLAEKLAQKVPSALRVIKESSRKLWQKPTEENYYPIFEYIDRVFDHYNSVEGVEAFLQKRKPNFDYSE